MTNTSYAHLSIRAISWHLFHATHLPLRTSMIRGEIKLFIILFLRPLPVAAHLKRHTGILMVAAISTSHWVFLPQSEQVLSGRTFLHEALCKGVRFTRKKQHARQRCFNCSTGFEQSYLNEPQRETCCCFENWRKTYLKIFFNSMFFRKQFPSYSLDNPQNMLSPTFHGEY